ncbi:hypothetical protein [Aeromonas dhakensis]|uniref:hypothetical protein n=1 Tax=Aeromonas dhakensis TaxID=196024 RepID=UPI00191CD536|nr:hypothetical protein [Aeromonas dhakensis]MBL0679181.1 hypothetical protein [Aeromonas dhakensis]
MSENENNNNNNNLSGQFVGTESFEKLTLVQESFKGIAELEKSFGGASSLSTQVPLQNTTQSPSSSGAAAMMPEITPQKKN